MNHFLLSLNPIPNFKRTWILATLCPLIGLRMRRPSAAEKDMVFSGSLSLILACTPDFSTVLFFHYKFYNLKQTFRPFQTAFTGTALFLALLLNVQGLFASNTYVGGYFLNAGGCTSDTISGSTTNGIDPSGVDMYNNWVGISEPEINLQGNAVDIVDGDSRTCFINYTDFGSVNVNSSFQRIFTIQNKGTGTLNIARIQVTKTNGSEFVVSGVPSSIPAGSSGTFTVTFSPTSSGTHNATIRVNSDDSDESQYDFAVKGVGTYPISCRLWPEL